MRNTPNLKVESFRVTSGPFASTRDMGNNGMFFIPQSNGKPTLTVLASDGLGWNHVSVSTKSRCPTWEEMCFIKDLFFRDDECVMQLHPPRKDYVSFCDSCLHLWAPMTQEEIDESVKRRKETGGHAPDSWKSPGVIPRPPSILVGPKKPELAAAEYRTLLGAFQRAILPFEKG